MLENRMAVWSILLPLRIICGYLVYFCGHFGIYFGYFGIFCAHFGIFFPFWYFVPSKIWQLAQTRGA
jgi:ABC-type spermidine/putrescine transport system permease subunit II